MGNPTPEQIKAARTAAGHNQSQAAETIYKGLRTWQQWEKGDRVMDPALYELYCNKANLNPQQMAKCMWITADNPPVGEVDLYTEPVAVVTNYGNVLSCRYFNSQAGGCWIRPAKFEEGEEIEFWAYMPNLDL